MMTVSGMFEIAPVAATSSLVNRRNLLRRQRPVVALRRHDYGHQPRLRGVAMHIHALHLQT